MSSRAPVLVQRELLLTGRNEPDPGRIEDLVGFQRRGRRLLLVAEQTARWRPTRKSVDHDLAMQQQLHQLIRRAGAELDGVIYLATGLFARRRTRLGELDQLAERYGVTAADLALVGREAILLESIIHSGGRALSVGGERVPGATGFDNLKAALDNIG